MFQFSYISLSFCVEMLEACLVDGIPLMSEYETDGRLDSRKEKKKSHVHVLRSLQIKQVLKLVLLASP